MLDGRCIFCSVRGRIYGSDDELSGPSLAALMGLVTEELVGEEEKRFEGRDDFFFLGPSTAAGIAALPLPSPLPVSDVVE